MSNSLLLGHRGVRGEKSVPENSLASFDLALAQGCDGFEFDVRLSADGEAVICHDAWIRGCEIAEGLAEVLSLPTLQQILSRYGERAFLDIELKVAGLETRVAELLKAQPPQRGFVVSSFLPGVLRELHALEPALPLGFICETPAQLKLWTDVPVDYVIPQYQLLNMELLKRFKQAGKKILVWTVNNPSEMKKFFEWDVDGVITDHPQRKR